MIKKIFISLALSQALLYGVNDDAKQIGDMIKNSPYSNEAQNKNISNSLKNQQTDIKLFNENTEDETTIENNEVLDIDEPKAYIKSYTLHLDNKEETFKSLGVDEKEIQLLISNFKNEELSIRTLKDIANIVSYYFQTHGYPAATAYIPPQDLSNANVQINITLGRLGKFIIKNSSGARDYAIESKLNQKLKGKILTVRKIEDSAYRVSEMNGVKVGGNIQAGDNYGESDVVIEVAKDKSATLLIYGDNYGTKETGRHKGGMSQTINNLARQGDTLNFYIQNTDENQINYGATYSTFIGNLSISPFISKSSYTLGGSYAGSGFFGTSLNSGVKFAYPIFLYSDKTLKLVFGFTHRELEDHYLKDIAISKKASNSGNVGIEGTYQGIENNSLSYIINFTYGNLEDDGSKIITQGPNLGNFGKMNININNEYRFQELLTHIFQLNYQKVIGGMVLDGSETTSIGGPYGVRAYYDGEGGADNAIWGSLGIRFQTPLRGFYLIPFYDIGYSWYQNKQYQNTNHYFMDAMGMQALYIKPGKFYIKADATRAVHKFKFDGKHRTRVYISTGLYF